MGSRGSRHRAARWGGLLLLGAPTVAQAQLAAGAPDSRDVPLQAACGPGDDRLVFVAEALVALRLAGQPLPDSEGLTRLLRDREAPYPWPRALAFDAPLDRMAIAQRLRAWVQTLPQASVRRCGVASGRESNGREAVVVVAAPALGEFEALPARIPVGRWVEVRVRALPGDPAGARIFVLGPTSSPFAPTVWWRGDRLMTRFLVDRPGVWKIQAIAELPTGPVPAAEGLVNAGDAPPRTGDSAGAVPPGDATSTEADVTRWINTARAAQTIAPVRDDADLRALAYAHARRLAAGTTPLHDAGRGDAVTRTEQAGLAPVHVGENVAHGVSLAAAHGRLWASPSHRYVMLSPRFRAVGIGSARGPDGSWWLVELFTGAP